MEIEFGVHDNANTGTAVRLDVEFLHCRFVPSKPRGRRIKSLVRPTFVGAI
jgi:hypothetical protein